ncbi:glutathione S-transferase family protein [Billgrantia ethanolica]|uniref:glutathione S-transferase family protein n=1 Tax=Billgrantia ethanolica TaxID=2733486 RepID=UPI001F299A24
MFGGARADCARSCYAFGSVAVGANTEAEKAPEGDIRPAGGTATIAESAAIQLYLAEKYPQAGFIPSAVEERAQMYRWIFFLMTEIEPPLWRIARHTFIYPDEMRIPQDVDLARQECREMLTVFERHMQEREYLVGDRLSVADFNAAYTLDWANEENLLDAAPRLREYLKAMYARPTAPPTIAAAFAAIEN